MRIAVAHIHSFGLDWPADRVPEDGIVDLEDLLAQVHRDGRAAEDFYFASLASPAGDEARERHFALEAFAHHVAAVLEVAKAIGDRSVGVGPIPRSTIETLGLPCSKVLTDKLVAAGDEVDLVQTMVRLVRDFRYYDREYDGLSAQRQRYGASWDDITDRHDELVAGIRDHQDAIRELAAILAAVCR
ncbi:MAG: hypothetical protein H0V17_12720 [Deltaproteobacteria bacterium]|nr:hypothetical protein [Deltaproteobacteria bacterium]